MIITRIRKKKSDSSNIDVKDRPFYSFSEKKKIFEYKLMKFIIENDLPFNKVQDLWNFLDPNINTEEDLKIMKYVNFKFFFSFLKLLPF